MPGGRPCHRRRGSSQRNRLPGEEIEYIFGRLHALHRYWLWATRLRGFSQNYLDEAAAKAKGQITATNFLSGHCFMFLAFWFGTLFVVIEGYWEIGVTDDRIEALLDNSNGPDLIRRFRNGIFHFQGNYFDKRVTELLDESERMLPWIESVHSAFSDFFLDIFSEIPGLRTEVDAMAAEVKSKMAELGTRDDDRVRVQVTMRKRPKDG